MPLKCFMFGYESVGEHEFEEHDGPRAVPKPKRRFYDFKRRKTNRAFDRMTDSMASDVSMISCATAESEKSSKLMQARLFGTTITLVNDYIAPLYARFSKKSNVEAERVVSKAIYKKMGGKPKKPSSEVAKTMHKINGIDVVQIVPIHLLSELERPTIFFYHGGGFTYNSIESYEQVLTKFSILLKVQVFSPEYRLAPEYPYPACFDDSYTTTEYILENAPSFCVNKYNYGLCGDSAGGDLALWIAHSLAVKLRQNKKDRDDFATNDDRECPAPEIPRPQFICPVYPCSQTINTNYYASQKSQKANKLLKQSFFSSRVLYLLGLKGDCPKSIDLVKKNRHLSNKLKHDPTVLEAIDAERWLPDRIGNIYIGNDLIYPQLGRDVEPSLLKSSPLMQQVQAGFDKFIPRILITKDKLQILKKYGPKKWIMATGEHDHSRDSVIILAKRLKHYGLPAELVLAEKAFHGFFTQSTVLDGFETKDNADVQLILDKMANAMDFQNKLSSSFSGFLGSASGFDQFSSSSRSTGL